MSTILFPFVLYHVLHVACSPALCRAADSPHFIVLVLLLKTVLFSSRLDKLQCIIFTAQSTLRSLSNRLLLFNFACTSLFQTLFCTLHDQRGFSFKKSFDLGSFAPSSSLEFLQRFKRSIYVM